MVELKYDFYPFASQPGVDVRFLKRVIRIFAHVVLPNAQGNAGWFFFH